MNCDDARLMLEASLDGELPVADQAVLDQHLAGCAECRAFRERRLALREALTRGLPRLEAPADLRRALEQAARPAVAPSRPVGMPGRGWWLGMAAALAIVAAGSWQLATARAAASRFTDIVLESHIRSLIGEHLTDVASTDQHTVKPWFNGRLDFSPPVYDFAGRGYPLIGGRLEYLGGRQVAALVYARRKHMINVYLWPAGAGTDGGASSATRNGYHLLHWSRADFTYWVVSDLGTPELQEFAGLLQGADSATAAVPR